MYLLQIYKHLKFPLDIYSRRLIISRINKQRLLFHVAVSKYALSASIIIRYRCPWCPQCTCVRYSQMPLGVLGVLCLRAPQVLQAPQVSQMSLGVLGVLSCPRCPWCPVRCCRWFWCSRYQQASLSVTGVLGVTVILCVHRIYADYPTSPPTKIMDIMSSGLILSMNNLNVFIEFRFLALWNFLVAQHPFMVNLRYILLLGV